MARLVKSSGRKIFFRYGGDAVRTRMYRSWPQMEEGWTKNLALLFGRPQELAIRSGLEFVFIFANLIAGISALITKQCNLPPNTRAGRGSLRHGVGTNSPRPFFVCFKCVCFGGLAVFVFCSSRSVTLHRIGGVNWKGRKYGKVADAVPD